MAHDPDRASTSIGACVLVASAFWLLACSSAVEQPGCPEGSTTERIESSRQLEAAIDTAAAGTCLALVAGSYEAVELPPGVSLVGDGRDVVTLVGITIDGGEGAVVSALSVRGLGITVAGGATGVQISNVHIDDSGTSGIDVQPGASVIIADVEIDDVTGVGVSATDAAEVVVSDARISRASSGGMIARCGSGCDCASSSRVSLASVSITDVMRIGLGFSGVEATVDSVEVTDVRRTSEATDWVPVGVFATGCSRLQGHSLRVVHTDPVDLALGLLLDGASAQLGTDETHGIEIEGNAGALWISNVTPELPVEIAFATLRRSRGVGVGIGPGSTGVALRHVEVLDTGPLQYPVLVDGSAQSVSIGDAVTWHAGAQATIDDLTVAGSARLGLIVDGPVPLGSFLGKVTLGADSGALVQQSLTAAGALETAPETPTLETLTTEVYPVIPPPITSML